jgi:hypothetical protein
MHDQDLTNTQALIDRYYTEEKARKAQALTHASLNLQLDANDLAMLSTIAKRFGKSRTDLAKDVLSHALIDLLTQLEPSERKLIARDADEMGSSMAQEIAEENGLKDIDHKPNVWTAHDRSIAKAEKKRAKELEDAAKAEKQAQESANFSEEVNTSHEEAQASNESSTTEENTVEETSPEDTMTESTETDLASNSNEYTNQEDSTARTFA